MKGKANNVNIKGNAKSNRKAMDAVEIKKLFNKLAKGKQMMSDDDLFEFLGKDLGLDSQDPVSGHIATNLMEIEKIEFTKYQNLQALFQKTKAGSLKQLIQIIRQGQLHNELNRGDVYKSMYRKLFKLYSGKYLTIDFEVAQMLWQVYLKDKLVFYKEFMQFLEKTQKKKIHQDLWNMMYDFSIEVKSLANYKVEDGWPVFIDGFIEYLKAK